MKKILLTSFVTISSLSFALSQDSLPVLVSVEIGKECWSSEDREINRHADSLNFANGPEYLPFFLNQYLFDWNRRNSAYNCHSNLAKEISFRKAIMDRVVSERVLKWIITSKNKNFDKYYEPEKQKDKVDVKVRGYYIFPNLPYMEKSWRELAKMRLEEIKGMKIKFK